MRKLLFVYGNFVHQAYTKMMMMLLGLDVDYVFDIKSAATRMGTSNYLAILIDIDALGLEAFDLAREIRMSDSEIPIVGVTDVADLHIMYKAIDNGMNVCIQRSELLETLSFYKERNKVKEVA
ncbi:MAG: response regulator [Bacteroidetes bacterium]|nr:response regulator [Bacteroidota bacterium]